MRRLLLLIAGILILTAVAVPSAAVYYFACTEAGLQYLFSRIPHKAAGVGLEFSGVHGTIAHGVHKKAAVFSWLDELNVFHGRSRSGIHYVLACRFSRHPGPAAYVARL